MIPDAFWAVFPAVQAILLLLPLALLSALSRSTLRRAVYRTWLSAALYVMLLAPISLLFPAAMQLQATLNIFLNLLFVAILLRLTRQPVQRHDPAFPEISVPASKTFNSRQVTLFILLITGTVVIPWGLFGALGSLLDTLLQTLAGLTLGMAIVLTLYTILLPGLKRSGLSTRRSILLGGFIAATAMLIFSSGAGYPFGGTQVLLAICLPPLAWLAVHLLHYLGAEDRSQSDPSLRDTLSRQSSRVVLLPVILLIGLSAAFPLAFVDPDELALVITFSRGELLTWALIAAAGAAGISLLASLELALGLAEHLLSLSRTLLRALAGAFWLIGVALYLLFGQPGFFGEELFVVLKDQADIDSASTIPDLVERRSAIYTALVSHASLTQADLRADLDRFGIDYTPYYLVNGLRLNGGPLIRLWLQTRTEVAQVLSNPRLRPLPQPPPQASGDEPAPLEPQWNLTQIGAERVHAELGVTGAGILVGQSDSGAQFDHPELADSYRGQGGNHDYSWYDPWNGTTQPTDIGGHGTHTLGSVLGNTTGVAPDAEWIACANLARNLGNPAYYLDCLQFMFAPFPLGGDPFIDGDPRLGPQVLNNSWGCQEIEGCQADTLLPAVQAFHAAGVFVVVSAGNEGPFCESINSPMAIYAEVFTVGANDQLGNLTIFSSRGPVSVDGSNRVKPDIIAPGDQVLSAMPGNSYSFISGTSMAGPHVAGTVALIWSANPDLIGDIERTREILASTARPYPYNLDRCPGAEDTPSTVVGYGLLDAYAAVRAANASP
jgi:subtilisin family serine protease